MCEWEIPRTFRLCFWDLSTLTSSRLFPLKRAKDAGLITGCPWPSLWSLMAFTSLSVKASLTRFLSWSKKYMLINTCRNLKIVLFQKKSLRSSHPLRWTKRTRAQLSNYLHCSLLALLCALHEVRHGFCSLKNLAYILPSLCFDPCHAISLIINPF